MAVSNTSSGSGSATWTPSTDLTITLPSYSAGDLGIVIAFANWTFNGTPSMNQSWTTLKFNNTSSNTDRAVFIGYKILGASETNPEVDMSMSTGKQVDWICATYGGIDASVPFDVTTEQKSSSGNPPTSISTDPITPVTDGNMLLQALCLSGSGQTISGIAGYSEVIERLSTNRNIELDEKIQATAATEPLQAWTVGTNDDYFAYTMSIRPGSSGGGGGGSSRIFIT